MRLGEGSEATNEHIVLKLILKVFFIKNRYLVILLPDGSKLRSDSLAQEEIGSLSASVIKEHIYFRREHSFNLSFCEEEQRHA